MLLLATAAALLACVSCAEKKAIAGHLDGLEGDSLSVKVYAFDNNRVPVQEVIVPVRDGNFEVDLKDSTVRNVILGVPGNPQLENGFARMIYIPGENVVLEGKYDSLVYSGSQYFKDKQAYDDFCKPDRDLVDSITSEYRAAMAADPNDPSIEQIVDRYDAAMEKLLDKAYEYVKANPDKLFSTSLIGSVIGEDGVRALELLDLVPDKVKEGVMNPVLEQTRAAAQKTKARFDAAENVKDGKTAPDFTLKNASGEDFTLSSIFNQKKYIILDFWGTWCVWCVKGIPDMKKLYADAKGKIEIISIDCGDTPEKWKEGLEKFQMPWLHVYNPGGDNDISIKYAVKGYPTKIILNPDGSINRTVVGEDPEFYTYVRGLIKK